MRQPYFVLLPGFSVSVDSGGGGIAGLGSSIEQSLQILNLYLGNGVLGVASVVAAEADFSLRSTFNMAAGL